MKDKENGVVSNFFDKVRWALYGLKIKIFKPKKNNSCKSTSMSERTRKKNIFLFFFLLFPVVQFLVFYVGVNFNSILLSIQAWKLDDSTGQGAYVITGLQNFGKVFEDIFNNGSLSTAIKNSTIQFLFTIVLGIPLHVTVAYVVFKEVPFSGFFKIMLFMPNMISSILFVTSFKYIMNPGIWSLVGINYIDSTAPSTFWTVMLFGQWMGFAGGLIIYLSAMSSISTDVLEYGKLEPLSSIKELWYVVIPSIFPTITTFLVTSIAGFFTNYGYFHTFFGGTAKSEIPVYDTLGYHFFILVLGDGSLAEAPYAAAAGIVFTIIAAPLTICVKWLLEKFGPSEE